MKKIENWDWSCFGWDGIMGVYALCTHDEKRNITVHYIGSSKNIGKRINNPNHHYRIMYRNDILVFVRFFQCKNYVEIEKSMIKKYKPSLNINGK